MKDSRVKATFHLETVQAEAMNTLSWHKRGVLVGMAVRRFLRTQEGRRMLFGDTGSAADLPDDVLTQAAVTKTAKIQKPRLPLNPKPVIQKDRSPQMQATGQTIKRPLLQAASKAPDRPSETSKADVKQTPVTNSGRQADFCVIGLNDFFA
ncbi:hypothetical protein FY034_18135 (plasmid) [Trichlorobacter lovleyi]|uniref:hypothetical protein n=1 Tax=Trichlorobacter lovleyi TaxID=313985 RepID=UPI00223F765F|nr:hypothetical protein [Trichlorobacter lovleyi]QOX80921.1 hypothetical protein FY034_18135 [Trichlorobacter lovleyi]